MFDNIGKKLQDLAVIFFVFMLIASVSVGIILISLGTFTKLLGIFFLIIAPIFSLIFAWLLYGFGTLIEKTQENASNTKAIVKLLSQMIDNNKLAVSTPKFTKRIDSMSPNSSSKNAANSEEIIECYSCGHTQQKQVKRCEKCDAILVPYVCGDCGYLGPYKESCPACNSKRKSYN